MNALLIAALIAAPAPSREQILRDRAGAAANRREAEARVKLPGATESLQIPVTGKGVDGKGNVYTFSGVVTLQIDTPLPPPPPLTTKLTGIRNPETAILVTTAAPGQRLVLEGELLTSETILVAIGGERATVTRAAAGMIEFIVPPVPEGKPPVLILYWLVNNNWVEKGRLPLTVKAAPTPTPTPTPTPPGDSPRVDSIQSSGEQVTITGSGFGTAPGRVLLDKLPVLVLTWDETRITGRSEFAVLPRLTLDLQRAGEGWHTQTLVGG